MLRGVLEPSLTRLLQLVQRQLGASDVRAEFGGKDPDDARVVWTSLSNGWRLVAIFDEPPPQAAVASQRLAAMAEAFVATTATLDQEQPVLSRALVSRRLDDELEALAAEASAIRAVVIDESSPVLWGSSEPRRGSEDVDAAIRTARLEAATREAGTDLAELLTADPPDLSAALQDRRIGKRLALRLGAEVRSIIEASRRTGSSQWRDYLLTARAIAAVRDQLARGDSQTTLMHHSAGFGYFARGFATIYRLILVFGGRFSELHAKAALIRALPIIERLVLALPPAEPPSGAGRVLRFPKRSS
jgi:hypothetical protein